MYSVIARGVAGIGIIAAMICNMGFNRAYIGFFVGCIFCLIGLIMISVCFIKTTAAIHMEDADQTEITASKNYVIRWFYGTLVIIACFFVFLLPLIALPYDTYMGITIDSWMGYGLLAAGLVAIVGVLFWWIFGVKKFAVSEKQKVAAKQKLKYVKRTAIALVITFFIQAISLTIIDTVHPFIEGTTFYTYEEFVDYMEQAVLYEDIPTEEMTSVDVLEGEENLDEEGNDIYDETYYDDNGNEITLEEYEKLYMTEELRDEKGNVVCTYIRRNENVASIRYGHIAYEEGEDMPVTVYTHEELKHEELVWNDLILPMFVLVYIFEIVAGIVFYYKNKKNK